MLIAAALMAQQAPYAGELRERLNAPIKASINSAKPPYDLEICVADVISVVGTPTVFRDGPDDVVIASSFPTGNKFLAAVSIRRVATGSHLDLRLQGKGWDDRITERLKACG